MLGARPNLPPLVVEFLAAVVKVLRPAEPARAELLEDPVLLVEVVLVDVDPHSVFTSNSGDACHDEAIARPGVSALMPGVVLDHHDRKRQTQKGPQTQVLTGRSRFVVAEVCLQATKSTMLAMFFSFLLFPSAAHNPRPCNSLVVMGVGKGRGVEW